MASNKISFTDKVSTIISLLPIINRIRAEDINEIKSVVNSHADDIDTLTTTVNQIALSTQVTNGTNSLTVGALTSNSGNKTLTNSGYYPVGVAGVMSSNNAITLSGFYMSDVASGTCKVTYKFNNISANQETATITVYVNWVKIS